MLLGAEAEQLLDDSNSVNINEPATLPDDTEVADDDIANSDRLVKNESSEVSYTDFTRKAGHDADGFVDGEVMQRALGSPAVSAEDRNKASSEGDDLIKTAVATKMESGESLRFVNNNRKGDDGELKSEDSAAVVDGSLVNESTELDSISVEAASAECNSSPSPVYSSIATSNADGPIDSNGPELVDLAKVGTSPAPTNDYWT